MVFIAIVTGVLSFFNYFWQSNFPLSGLLQTVSLIAQCLLAVITVFAAIRYRGKRSRNSYNGGQYKVFTLPFAVIILSIIGNIAILVVFIFRSAGIVTSL